MADNLVVAKNAYTQQLTESISPSIYNGIISIFEKCKDRDTPYKCFQKKLCDIPLWNQNIISAEHDRIIKESKLEWLDMLIEAIFICNIKILSSIKSTPNTINIKLPDSKTFIHQCYIQVGRSYYMQPKTIIQESVKNIDLIKNAINKTILHIIPHKDVIESCLKQPDESQEIHEENIEESVKNIECKDNPESDSENDNRDNSDTRSNVSESKVTEDVFMNPPDVDADNDTFVDKPHDENKHENSLNDNRDGDGAGDNKEPEQHNSGGIFTNDNDLHVELNDSEPVKEPINLDVTSGDNLETSLDPPKKEEDAFFFSDSDSD